MAGVGRSLLLAFRLSVSVRVSGTWQVPGCRQRLSYPLLLLQALSARCAQPSVAAAVVAIRGRRVSVLFESVRAGVLPAQRPSDHLLQACRRLPGHRPSALCRARDCDLFAWPVSLAAAPEAACPFGDVCRHGDVGELQADGAPEIPQRTAHGGLVPLGAFRFHSSGLEHIYEGAGCERGDVGGRVDLPAHWRLSLLRLLLAMAVWAVSGDPAAAAAVHSRVRL